MPTDTKLNQLIINQLTQEQYDEAKAAGTLSDTELYITDSDDEALTNNKISNCITEIPQDIKLELNNGTLTLKAGSKVYVPNGFESDGTTKKFDIITIAEDKSYSWNYTGSGFVMVYINGNLTVSSTGSETVSSLTPAKTYKIFYNTTDNKCYFDESTTSLTQVSFPIARFTATDSITSIDQVFNGFGYIGSTVFALPGVKGLIPNGRNADGSLKNIEFTLDKVLASTRDWNVSNQYNQHIRLGLNTIFTSNGYVESVNMPTVNNYIMWYNPRDNIMRYNDTNNSVTSIADYPIVEMIELGGTGAGDGTSRITSFTPKTVFHALDYNDKSTISGWSMPSSRYIDLTLGASGSTYAAPANGYLYFKCQGPTSYFYIVNKTLENNGGELGMCVNFAGGYYRAFLPVLKGHTITTYYDGSITSSKGCFIYAEGEQYNPVSSSSGGNEMGGTGEIVGIGGEGEETDPYL